MENSKQFCESLVPINHSKVNLQMPLDWNTFKSSRELPSFSRSEDLLLSREKICLYLCCFETQDFPLKFWPLKVLSKKQKRISWSLAEKF